MVELNKIYNENCLIGLKKVEDNTFGMCVTSPPYNVGIEYDSYDDTKDFQNYLSEMKDIFTEVFRVLKDDGRICLNIPYEINKKNEIGRVFFVSEFDKIMKDIGFKFNCIIDLHEENPHRSTNTAWGSWLSPSSPYVYNPKECCVIYYKKNWKKENCNTKISKEDFLKLIGGIWNYTSEKKVITKCNFSLDIPLNAITMFSDENDIILDPFMGGGTTAIACLMKKRDFIGYEISSNYHKISQKRIKDYKQKQSSLLKFN